jgi:hypothetical protein
MTNCHDCRGLHHDYMVKRPIWALAVPPKLTHIKICLHCLQQRLGRQLTPNDFDFTIVINKDLLFGCTMGQLALIYDWESRMPTKRRKKR